MAAFMHLGRWAGMAICDIVQFNPRVSVGENNVLVYRRRKTGEIASILLDPAVAASLRSIPPEADSDPERPFRFPGTAEASNCQVWRDRFRSLCEFAGVTHDTRHLRREDVILLTPERGKVALDCACGRVHCS
jgi:hypothetical protein